MNQYQIDEIREKVKKVLSEERYKHTLGVMNTAKELAECYGEDVEKALVAGLLHDCAKHISTNLLHAKDGALLAREEYGVMDSYITDAIRYHTTGRPKMTLLDKIIYVADYIEPNRDKAPNLANLRQMAFQNIDECLYRILEDTLEYLKIKNRDIDPTTEETYLYYKNEMQK